ncbi:MAG: 50S ribosomal protein L30 [Treponema sp.]|jgi:large subunit ribosomal protein L30|nr:50S ribosomal protein L30 [Treponema sp.]
MAKIKIRLVRSTIGQIPRHRATVRSLGLRKIGSSAVQEDTPAILGMVRNVSHLVSVESVSGEDNKGSK